MHRKCLRIFFFFLVMVSCEFQTIKVKEITQNREAAYVLTCYNQHKKNSMNTDTKTGVNCQHCTPPCRGAPRGESPKCQTETQEETLLLQKNTT